MKMLKDDCVWCLFMNDALLTVYIEQPSSEAIVNNKRLEHYPIDDEQAQKAIEQRSVCLGPMVYLRLEQHKVEHG